MIVKITDQNSKDYGEFLTQAYQYLEELEWHRAYQYLLKLEADLEKTIIQAVDIDNKNSLEADKRFYTFAQFKNYEEEYYKTNYSDVKIIYEMDRNDAAHTFTTIEQYYNYIEIIKNSARSSHFLLKLPLDEGIIGIDANERTIKIPKEFVSTVIQKDSLAETMVFTVDRFIDNIDLANVDKIYVQWSAPGENGTTREQATEITLIDLDDGTIKFGWPISDHVTQFPGRVDFSVTFFTENPNDKTSPKFRLNTQTASFEVKPALQATLNDQSTLINPSTSLFNAIRNNRYPGQGIKAPVTPEFTEPGRNLENNDPIEIADEEGKRLKFKAQAVTPDNGSISYTWWFNPAQSDRWFNCEGGSFICTKDNPRISEIDYNYLSEEGKRLFDEDFCLIDSSEDVSVPYPAFGTVYSSFDLVDKDNLQLQDEHFVPVDKEDSILYEDENKLVYLPTVYVNTDSKFIRYNGTEEHKKLPIYEKYTIFEVPPEKDIIGVYKVIAISSKSSPLVSSPRESMPCEVKGPIEIEIDKNLNKNQFMYNPNGSIKANTVISKDEYDRIEGLLIDEDKEAFAAAFQDSDDGSKICQGITFTLKECNLKPTLKNYSGELNYEWYRSIDNKTFAQITDQTNDELNVNEIGWYKVKIISKKNRHYEDFTSETCRVILKPQAPVLSLDTAKTTSGYVIIDGVYTFDDESVQGEAVTLSVTPSIMVNGVNKINDALYSDNLLYIWERQEKDGVREKIDIKDLHLPPTNKRIDELSTISIKINPEFRYTYICSVKNVLNEEEATPSNEIAFSVG